MPAVVRRAVRAALKRLGEPVTLVKTFGGAQTVTGLYVANQLDGLLGEVAMDTTTEPRVIIEVDDAVGLAHGDGVALERDPVEKFTVSSIESQTDFVRVRLHAA